MARLLLVASMSLTAVGETPPEPPIYRMDPVVVAKMQEALACIRRTHAELGNPTPRPAKGPK